MLLCRLTGATLPSGLAAALFALHPLQVESVAWVTERKDVLSTFFGLLALHAHAGYAARPGITRYLLVVLWLGLGLLAKPMLVTLPGVMLLLDYWPLNRLGPARIQPAAPGSKLILEKLPLFALAVAAAVVTVLAQRDGNAVRTLDEFSLAARLGNAVVSYVSYLDKIIWPFDLAVFYPHPGTPSFARVAGALIFLAAMTGLIVWRARWRPYLLVGWLWFVGTLLPVSGVLQAGWQGMADRFVYFPSVGLFLILAFALGDILATGRRRLAICMSCVAPVVAVLSVLSVRTMEQVTYWQNSLTLWEHARRVTPDNFYTRFSYGAALLDVGRVDEAAEQFVRSLELKPDHPFGHYELGLARREQGRLDEAIASWTTALRLAPEYAEARLALAEAQARRAP